MSEQVQRAQQELMELQRRQEMLEQQKRELEELSVKQQEVLSGRKEMVEKLRRALMMLEREEEDARRELEQIQQTRQVFGEVLEGVDGIRPEEWDPDDLEPAVTEALALVDHARAVFTQNRAKLRVLRGEEGEPEGAADAGAGRNVAQPAGGAEEGEFGTWLKRGFALNLPLVLLGIVWLVVYLMKGP